MMTWIDSSLKKTNSGKLNKYKYENVLTTQQQNRKLSTQNEEQKVGEINKSYWDKHFTEMQRT